jgi:hypothetical protein
MTSPMTGSVTVWKFRVINWEIVVLFLKRERVEISRPLGDLGLRRLCCVKN